MTHIPPYDARLMGIKHSHKMRCEQHGNWCLTAKNSKTGQNWVKLGQKILKRCEQLNYSKYFYWKNFCWKVAQVCEKTNPFLIL